ncbi:lipase family protein [Massilia sp. W12]|uniref:lipase family protein n=1 Tax=Massilia sp. W12 TaxID=3126507 RepID=UPI0030D14C5A
MTALTPKQAAQIAKKVYDLRKDADWDLRVARGVEGLDTAFDINGMFTLNGGKRMNGTSGGTFLRARSGFGFIASGVGNRSNELLIAIRGTASLFDGVTDLVQSVTRGPSGYMVHAGFHRTFDSFKEDIAAAIAGSNKPATVHVVGHSLGGALATITADFLSEQRTPVKLYTFGCPRVGFTGFSRSLTQKLGTQNMFRVHHSADVVSMVPIFPFSHTPINRDEYSLPWNGASISVNAHFMDNYIQTIGDMNWDGLIRTNPEPSSWQQAEDWLKAAATNGGVCKMLSAGTLWMLMKCIDWILDKIGTATNVVAGSAALIGVTVMDRLAQILYQGAAASVQVSSYVGNLMIAILRFLGRAVVKTVSLTVQFISWVLNMLYNVMSQIAHTALQRLF